MNRISYLIATAGVSLCLYGLGKADEIEFSTLPQVVQHTVIQQTRIANPQKVIRVVQESGVYAVTVNTDSGQQIVYVNPAGNIVQAPAVQETTTTTTTTEPEAGAFVTYDQIQQGGSRYELIKKDKHKEVYLDHQTGKKVTVKEER
jgi:hypothetical protein